MFVLIFFNDVDYAERRDDGTDMQLVLFKRIKVWDEQKKSYVTGYNWQL